MYRVLHERKGSRAFVRRSTARYSKGENIPPTCPTGDAWTCRSGVDFVKPSIRPVVKSCRAARGQTGKRCESLVHAPLVEFVRSFYICQWKAFCMIFHPLSVCISVNTSDMETFVPANVPDSPSSSNRTKAIFPMI